MVVHFRQPNCLSGVVCNGGRGGSGLFAEEFINLSVTESMKIKEDYYSIYI